MIYVFYGKDSFRAHEALQELERTLDTDGMLADNTSRVEGSEAKPDELLSQCQTIPFLGANRLVIVRGLLERRERRGRGRRPAGESALGSWEGFVAGLRDMPDTTTLVFIDGELGKRNAFLEALRPLADIREFSQLRQNEVAAWINQRAGRYGVRLEARAVALLSQLVGNQLGILDSELQKLAVYANGAPVSEDDVRAMVSLARDPNIFAMADAVVEGRTSDAAALVQRLLDDGEPVLRMLALIARQYRLLLLTRDLQDKRARPAEIGAKLGVPSYVVQQLLKQAPLQDPRKLRWAYRRILEADLSVKRGQHEDRTALELLLFDLSMLRNASPGGGRGYSKPPAGRPGRPPSAVARH